MTDIDFTTNPEKYRHGTATYDGAVATVTMAVDPDAGLLAGATRGHKVNFCNSSTSRSEGL